MALNEQAKLFAAWRKQAKDNYEAALQSIAEMEEAVQARSAAQ
jgi:hypothetical protein